SDFMGRDLVGPTLGLVGIGHTGTRLARMASTLGMAVIAFDPYLSDEEICTRGARPVDLQGLLENADVVSLHCPLDDSTRGMIGRAELAHMKRGSFFISTARGGIPDEQ